MMAVFQTLLGGLLALAGVIVAQSWTTRREYAKRRIDLAEDVLSLFYEARDAIRAIRSPGGWSSEGKSRKRAGGETEEEAGILDRAYAVVERYRKEETVFNNLKSKKYRFMAVFRSRSHEPFEEINRALNKIFVAAHMLGSHYWQVQGRVPMMPEQFREHLREMREQESIFWQTSDHDAITEIVDAAVRKIEAFADMAAKEYAGPPSWWQRWSAFAEGKADDPL